MNISKCRSYDRVVYIVLFSVSFIQKHYRLWIQETDSGKRAEWIDERIVNVQHSKCNMLRMFWRKNGAAVIDQKFQQQWVCVLF